jgi:hypothetical protein
MIFRAEKISISLLLFLVTINLTGQKKVPATGPWEDEKLFNMGYSIGFNVMDFRITGSESFNATDSLFPGKGSHSPGINIHLVANFKLNQFFDIRLLPGVSFGQRIIDYESRSLTDTVTYGPQKLESNFIELPLLVKYGWRMQNIKPYLISGLNYRYDFYAKDDYRLERPVYLRLGRPDLYYELGTGIDFYLKYIKLSVELKMSGGFNDMLVHDPHPDYPQYCNAIEKLKSRIWVLSFHFE